MLLVDGIECAAWGHGMTEVWHEFFGSRSVIDALAAIRPDWEAEGSVDVGGCSRGEGGVEYRFMPMKR